MKSVAMLVREETALKHIRKTSDETRTVQSVLSIRGSGEEGRHGHEEQGKGEKEEG